MRRSTLFGVIALCVLFLKLPGVPELIGIHNCKSCTTTTPYIPMLAAAYFAGFLSIILSFRSLPTTPITYGGLAWSLGLAVSLTSLSPFWCMICLIAHVCHIGMWIFWKPQSSRHEEMVGLKVSMALTTSVAMAALFSTLNFTFLIYGLNFSNPIGSLIKTGSTVAPFNIESISLSSDELSNLNGVILNFVSPQCLYCKEQLPKLDEIASSYTDAGFRFVNVTREITPELKSFAPSMEWAEDGAGILLPKFGIDGYPTLVVMDSKGTVVAADAGVASDFTSTLNEKLKKLLSE